MNIEFISSTSEVSKVDKSKFTKLLEPENIDCIFSTFDVLKFDKSKDTIFWQLLNIFDISVTWLVSNLFKPLI